ncbi:hypothetical protein GGQ68_002387 [Sagittula marina]|uniref:Uncharacterized protein n=1 Tax=Sagittula marina TaxID=943940 RepID=A0A7W6DNW3_9RHOB|nr:hypothetical protein [Sagittula marina]MBB3986049.1 hypothetical protein [Sagittula marina]
MFGILAKTALIATRMTGLEEPVAPHRLRADLPKLGLREQTRPGRRAVENSDGGDD